MCFVCACVISVRFLPVNLNEGIGKINMISMPKKLPVISFLKIIDSVFRFIIVPFQEDHDST